MVGPLADICRHVGTHTLFVGEFDADTEQELRDLLGPRALFPPSSLRRRRAGYLAELGWTALETRGAPRINKRVANCETQASGGRSFGQQSLPPPPTAEA